MATVPIDLGDFTCSVCREIFENPVTLSCSHAYCQGCLDGLRKASSLDEESLSNTQTLSKASSISTAPTFHSLIYTPQVHDGHQCYVCAICRTESLGYLDCRDLETDLKTIEASCPNCSKSLMLGDLRKHSETCTPPKKPIDAEGLKKIFSNDFLQKLSQPQVKALEKARNGENRSTFQCPYCERANFTVEHLCKHMEKHHLNDHPSRVCPICASMPWGERDRISTNVYNHILTRHRFDYNTFVNFDQDEESMMAEAIERSMTNH